jgi:hypothetical protein
MIKKILFVTAIAAMGAGCATTSSNNVASNDSDITNRAPAAVCQDSKATEKGYDCKNARSGDAAAQYMRDPSNGNFFRYMRTGQTCQVTSGVTDFKIAKNDDAAYAYYEAKGDLFVVYNQGAGGGNCPPVVKTDIMKNVDVWKIVPAENLTVVNAALSKGNHFTAWGPSAVLYSDDNVVEFEINTCYGQAGKAFSSYAIFTRDVSNNITKVKVVGSGPFTRDDSKPESQSFKSIAEFKAARKVCN